MTAGKFITLEGIEGAGKSTAVNRVADLITRTGRDVLVTREPGGTDLGEQIRHILLMQKTLNISAPAELLLMFAARAQHLVQVIRPALNAGKIVICDRFTDSTRAYQGGGRGLSMELIEQLAGIVHPDLQPDLTLLLDVPAETGLRRARQLAEADRFESEAITFFESARKIYLQIAAHEPHRVKVIDASQTIEKVLEQISNCLRQAHLC